MPENMRSSLGGKSPETSRTRGRKLDTSRNAEILDVALHVLAELGYEGMTIDLVAARANAARATVYRRWATKAELALDAVEYMSRGDAEHAPLPDTGNVRDDLVAAIAPHSIEEQEFRIKVMGGLGALAGSEPRLAASAGLAPWVGVSRAILQRAVDRGEYPGLDITMIAQVVPMMCVCRVAVQQLPITHEFSLSLIDDVILPALRGSLSH